MRLVVGCVLGLFAAGVCADAVDEFSGKLAKAIPGLQVKSISESAVSNLMEVTTSGEEVLYVTKDAKHFLVGDLFFLDTGKMKNLTEDKRKESRVEQLSQVPEADFLVFAPKETKATINVFTDIDCYYCRKLHQEIVQLNGYGIRVNYLAYPRAGIGSESYQKAVSAWCADDRQAAMTQAKNGQDIPMKTCDNPVAEEYELGRKLGITGTPAIILESGEIIRGYLPADKLAGSLGLL